MMTVTNVQLRSREPKGEGLLSSIEKLKIKEYSVLAQLPESCKQFFYSDDLKLKNNHVSNTGEHDSFSCVCVCAHVHELLGFQTRRWESRILFVQQLPILGKY